MRGAIVLTVLGALCSSATAERAEWTRDRLGFFYEGRGDMVRHVGVPKNRVAMFAARPRGGSDSVREARFVVALRDPEDAEIVVGAKADWVSVAARAYSEVRGGKLVPHLLFGEPCEDDDQAATCYPGSAEYLRLTRRVGWETAGEMFAIVRERDGKRFLIVGYAEKRPDETDRESAAARAKDLAFSVRLERPR